MATDKNESNMMSGMPRKIRSMRQARALSRFRRTVRSELKDEDLRVYFPKCRPPLRANHKTREPSRRAFMSAWAQDEATVFGVEGFALWPKKR
jgi:hypothetical protein